MEVTNFSPHCKQERLKEAVRSVIDLVKQPFYALRDSLSKIVKSLKAIVKRIRQVLIAMKRLVLSILRVIESVFDWLGSIVSVCNAKLGTPYDRCEQLLEDAVSSCKEKLGDVVGSVCSVAYLSKTICFPLKPIDVICIMVSFVSDTIVGDVKQRVKVFAKEMRALFFVKIKFEHSFHFETNKSRSIAEVSTAISSEIKRKTNRFLSFFDWVGLLTSFFFLFLFLKVMYYRYKWLTSDRFDNHYISGYMRDIDLRRARLDKETIFPLNRRERRKYATLSSVLLVKSERIRLAKSLVFLLNASIKLGIYMAIDYCLFWVLDTIRFHAERETRVPRSAYANAVQVKGRGFLADVYRGIIRAFSPYSYESELQSLPCLPNPKPPDYDKFIQIASLALLCWIMALFEPYGLRLRHLVLGHYYPDRAKQRAVWLYNHIMRSRGSFLKYARRQLRRSFGIGSTVERVTLRERVWAVCPVLNRLWPLKLRNACLVCGTPERDKSAPHVRCPTPGCLGVYCPQCFADLRKLCTVCLSPLDYGDLTDISEERDSSDDQIDLSQLKNIHLQPQPEKGRTKIRLSRETSEAQDDEDLSQESDVTIQKKDVSDDDSSSKYSYSYQTEATEDSALPEKPRFKDVEAQEVRDDVTMQIFNEVLPDVESSTSGKQITCFGFIRKKKSGKNEVKIESCKINQSDSTSIADTESWPTEEVDDDQSAVIEIDTENSDDDRHSSDEPLIKHEKRKKAVNTNRVVRWLKAVGKIVPFIKKNEKSKRPVETKNVKDSIHTGDKDETPSSSNSSIHDDDHQHLISSRFEANSVTDKSMLRKRIIRDPENGSDSRVSNESSRQNQEHLLNRNLFSNLSRPAATKIPRQLAVICKNTKYFEVDESQSNSSPRERIRYHLDYSTVTDSQSSVDSNPSRDRRSPTSEADDNDSYIYTSENDQKRYQTHTETTGSFVDVDLSEFSSDYSDQPRFTKKIIANNDEMVSAKNKIDDDSDEKSKVQFKRFEGMISDFTKRRKDVTDGRSLGNNESINKQVISKSIVKSLERSDDLKKYKVAKETANVKKRDSLKNIVSDSSSMDEIKKKLDKCVCATAEDIDENVRRSNTR
ncbi:hypothetical protein QAD02_022913 [Eretmocerus hayati]|nr:hypothetical protein QAD02_022913 [Eretmocerus hayati]